jgi:hypothetical protein
LLGRITNDAKVHGTNVRIAFGNVCWLPDTGWLRNNGDADCPVPAGAYVSFDSLVHMSEALKEAAEKYSRKNLMGTRLTANQRKGEGMANETARTLLGTQWHAVDKNIAQEWALRIALCGGVKTAAPVAEAAPAAAPVDDLMALVAELTGDAAAPVVTPVEAAEAHLAAAPAPDAIATLEEALALAGVTVPPVAQATEAQPVATTSKDALVAMAVAHHDMPKSSAQRLTVSVLESILGL